MMDSVHPLKRRGVFRYLEMGGAGGDGPPVLLLHGMIGGIGNWDATAEALSRGGHRVLVPHLPVFERSRSEASVVAFAHFIAAFLDEIHIERVVVAGNSLGGHIATLLCLEHPDRVAALLLLGSSGIDEMDMGATAIRRNDRAFLRKRAELTFFDPIHVTDRLLDEIIEVINDRSKAFSILHLAKSVKTEMVAHRLGEIRVDTLIVWGRDDHVTPPAVAETFAAGIAGSRLHWMEQCGHAPMMEHPEAFNRLLLDFVAPFMP